MNEISNAEILNHLLESLDADGIISITSVGYDDGNWPGDYYFYRANRDYHIQCVDDQYWFTDITTRDITAPMKPMSFSQLCAEIEKWI